MKFKCIEINDFGKPVAVFTSELSFCIINTDGSLDFSNVFRFDRDSLRKRIDNIIHSEPVIEEIKGIIAIKDRIAAMEKEQWPFHG